jgi:hypothetical protein
MDEVEMCGGPCECSCHYKEQEDEECPYCWEVDCDCIDPEMEDY